MKSFSGNFGEMGQVQQCSTWEWITKSAECAERERQHLTGQISDPTLQSLTNVATSSLYQSVFGPTTQPQPQGQVLYQNGQMVAYPPGYVPPGGFQQQGGDFLSRYGLMIALGLGGVLVLAVLMRSMRPARPIVVERGL